MDFELTKEQQQLRNEVYEFIKSEVSPSLVSEVETAMLGAAYRDFLRKVGGKGWLCPTWAPEDGGIGSSYIDRIIIYEELCYHRALLLTHVNSSTIAGPAIMEYGSPELKEQFILPIARGEIEFALGYTEPEAGSDLASLQMKAVEDGDDFIVNGQKIFNTGCHYADYHWLAVRTDPDAPPHRGISLLIADLKSPGITFTPLWTIAGWRTNTVFYDNVRVPKKNLVGEKNQGWRYIVGALSLERGFLYSASYLRHYFEEILDYVSETKLKRPGVLPPYSAVQYRLGELATKLEISKLLLYRVACLMDNGTVPDYYSCIVKTFLTELWQNMGEIAMWLLGPEGCIQGDSRWAQLQGKVARFAQWGTIMTLVAGSSEIMRNLIAQTGVGLPRQ